MQYHVYVEIAAFYVSVSSLLYVADLVGETYLYVELFEGSMFTQNCVEEGKLCNEAVKCFHRPIIIDILWRKKKLKLLIFYIFSVTFNLTKVEITFYSSSIQNKPL